MRTKFLDGKMMLEFFSAICLMLIAYTLGLLDGWNTKEKSIDKLKPATSEKPVYTNYSHLKSVAEKLKAKNKAVNHPAKHTYAEDVCEKIYDAEVVKSEIKINETI
jgi:hypothetical protein